MVNKYFRHISAILLLAVFVTMTVFTDFHRHNIVNVLNICENCQHNIPHPNHISSAVSFENICLLCQWTNNLFDFTHFKNITVCLAILQTVYCNVLLKHTIQALKNPSNKAPPYYVVCNM
ncbi:MAG: hypothetical protein J6P44_09885 [Bacteroidales bacterium]|nr:hypothetical protein [Bacteroidales bacterium]